MNGCKALIFMMFIFCYQMFLYNEVMAQDNEVDAEMIREIVIQAAKNVSWNPDEQEDYLEIIGPVLEMGEQALPVLDQLSRDTDMTPFERRISQLISYRIKEPDLFNNMDEFLQTYVLYWPGRHDMRYASIGGGKLLVEMLEPDTREFVEKYNDIIANIQLAPEPETVYDGEKTKEIFNKLNELGVPADDSTLLTLIIRRPVRFISSEYLFPFEEAIIRTLPPFEGSRIEKVQMQQRLALMWDLMQFDEPQSAIILAELDRRLAATEEETMRRYILPLRGGFVGRMFENWPEEVVLREIVRTVEFEREHPEARRHSRTILVVISRSEDWQAFLEEAARSDDPQVAQDAAFVKELIQNL